MDTPSVKLLDLELAGGCNYACQMCPHGESPGREKEFKRLLPFDVFKKIVDDGAESGAEVVTLHGGGEPTLHKKFIDCIKYVKDKGLVCKTFTNGSRITPKLSEDMVSAGLDLIRFSVIGYDDSTYREWMRSDMFRRVRENAKYLVEISDSTEVHSNHLIMNAARVDDEVRKYRENWVDYTGTQAEIWLMHNWAGEYQGPYGRPAKEKRTCGRPFHPTLQVRAGGLSKQHGAVVACCMVLGNDSEAVLGHLDTQTIQEVLDGAPYRELRKAHQEGRFDDISYCKNCDQLYDVPESLVWTNIPGRQYNQSKSLHGVSDTALIHKE